jgi:hypothetical protein
VPAAWVRASASTCKTAVTPSSTTDHVDACATERRARGRYDKELAELVRSLDPTPLDEPGIGPISAAPSR